MYCNVCKADWGALLRAGEGRCYVEDALDDERCRPAGAL